MSIRWFSRLVSVLSIALLAISALSATAAAPTERKPYIVQFVDGTNTNAQANALRGRGASVSFVYRHVMNGLAANLTAADVTALSANPAVLSIEADGVVTASALATQTGATWGLDRIDQSTKSLNGTYTYSYTGAGVTAYVVDTGILATHSEFGTRVQAGYSAITDGLGTADCNGHGTHVSGTIGGSTYGVAKNVTIVPVRVLDCAGSGSNSGVIAGLDWINGQLTDWSGSDLSPTATPAPAVVSMSLGGGASTAMDAAVARLVDSGVSVVVAAGNSAQNACNFSPARTPGAVTVAASASNGTADSFASYSNYGSCVDVIAPGSAITSTWIDGCGTANACTNTISGTSMATPHVSGVVALLLSQFGSLPPATVSDAVYAVSTKNSLTTVPSGTKNALLFSSPSGYAGTLRYRANPATNVNTTALSRSVAVSWTPSTNNGGATVTSQTLQVWSGTTLVKTVTGLSATTTGYTVTGLSRTTTYMFRIGTVNALGTSYSASTGGINPLK